jgi:peptidoglycan/xylan/chitin deacetylase (PgdA/CDA1 family)
MKVVLVVIAALVTLGLAAVGVVAAQKSGFSSQPTERVARAAAADPVKSVPPAAPARLSPIRDADMPAAMTAAPPATTAPVATPAAPALPAAASVTPAPAPPVPPAPQRVAENTAKPAAAAPAANANAAPPAAPGIGACDKPGGMGLTRIVEIDTTGGPGFGFQHFKQYDFLRTGEVVLTFDDGPWPENTPAVLKALSDNCLKATFFEIGQHAMWHPEIAKQVAAGGNTVGTHTWSHKDLAKNPYASDTEQAKQEIEMGISAVHMAVAAPISPFFRFPALQHPPELLSYLAERNIASFSTDIDSFDFKMRKPQQVIDSVMHKLQKQGKGIILMHDFQHATAEAMPELIQQLKAGGYKVVHVVPRAPVATLQKYDDMVNQQDKLSVNNTRPSDSVVRTIGEYIGGAPPPAAQR